ATTTLDWVAFGVVCFAGIAAGALQLVTGRDSWDLLALMVVGAGYLILNLNLRLVAILRRQRRRKSQGGGDGD
ncbi:MAG: hypothetical protein L0191_08570, partial [Acidobacteria bacterium]|nr:hypothetical protein [Acidobacteriota bacterium]